MAYRVSEGLEVVPIQGKIPVSSKVEPDYHSVNDQRAHSQSSRTRSNLICGVSRKVFFVTLVVAAAIVVAAALAGGLAGGLSSKSNRANTASPSATTTTVTIPSSSSTSTSSAATASSTTYLSDCPNSNNTKYTSTKFSSGGNGAVPAGAKNGLVFVKKCGLNIYTYQNLAQTQVTSFDSCINMCASYNFWHNSTTCTGLTYTGTDCWIKYGDMTLSDFDAGSSGDSAILATLV